MKMLRFGAVLLLLCYGEDFAAEIRSDATLGTVLDRAGVESLSEYLRTRNR
jgi:hypothetical protein